MSDDIELNVVTLEPEEDEEKIRENDERCKEDYKNEQRVSIYKPPYLIQYWIDTGNAPHKLLLDDESSETGQSLSEEDIMSKINSISTVLNDNSSNMINLNNKSKSDSSCSSVDTAAYILSNANVTKKADVISIVEGAKYTDKSLRECVKHLPDNVVCIGTARNDVVHDNNDNINTLRNITAKRRTSHDTETHVQQHSDSAILSNEHASSQSSCCEESNRNNISITNQKGLNIKNIDIVSIFQQFDKTSKRLSQDSKTDSSQSEVSEKDVSHSKQALANDNAREEVIDNDRSLKRKTNLHRKKLYTGRNSPVDLMLAKKHSINKISERRKTLHPALDSEDTIKKKLSSAYTAGSNRRSLPAKNHSDLKIDKNREKKKFLIFNKNTADINSINDKEITDNNVHKSDISFQSLSNPQDDSDAERNDISLRDNNDRNISIKEKISMPDLASLNLNPVVLLEPLIVSSFKQFNSIKTNHTTQKYSDDGHLNKSKKCICDFKTTDLETVESDGSTILICKCEKNTAQCKPASNQCLLDSINENDSTSDTMNDEKDNKKCDKENNKMNNKPSSSKSLKSADISRSKRAVVVLERLSPSRYHLHKTRITKESQKLNANEPIKEILYSSGTHSSNLYEIANKKNNIKLQEIKIVLERLSANSHVERSSDISNINNSTDGKNISDDIRMHNNKREVRVKTKTPIYGEDIKRRSFRSVRKVNYNYSSSSSDIISEHEDQSLNKMQQHKHRVNQVKRRGCSILTSISSDENDFVQYICSSGKKLKTSPDNEVRMIIGRNDDKIKLVNKNEDCSNEELSLLNHSSKKTASKKVSRLIKRKNGPNGIKRRSCSNPALTDLLQMNKNDMSPASRKINNNAIEISNKHEEIVSFNFNGDTDNDSGKRLHIMTNKNKIDHKNNVHKNNVILFQTKMLYTDSSESEGSNDCIISNRKTETQVNNSTRNLRYDRANKKRSFNHSVTKKCNQEDSNLSKSIIKQRHHIKTRSISIYSEKERDERFANEKFNNSVNSEISDATRGTFATSNITDVSGQKKISLYISSRKNDLNNASTSKQTSNESSLTNLTVIQPENAKKSVSKLLTFQTKNYYDSDSKESL